MTTVHIAELELSDFWEASSLHDHNAAAFANRVLGFEPDERGVHPFAGSGPPVALAPVRDRFQRRLEARRSGRCFSARPLDDRALTRILAAVGTDSGGRSVVPSAGGLGSVHTFGVGSNVEGPVAASVFRYDAAVHAVHRIGDAPPTDELRRLFQLECDGTPQLILVFVADLAPVLRKYGPRGGRFVVQEAGHAAQNVSLRLTCDGLTGYVLGGTLDRDVLTLLGVAHLDAIVVGAVACGR